MDLLLQPWPWYVAGPLIALCMYLLFFFGKKFGISSNLETLCAMGGAGKFADSLKLDWKKEKWNLIVVLGMVLGGFITNQWLSNEAAIQLNPNTVEELSVIGIANAGENMVPNEIFGLDVLFSLKGFSILILAGFLVGFGARYAGGCTSGHGIVGLSQLSKESLIAIIGFFIGGIFMTWFVLPYLF